MKTTPKGEYGYFSARRKTSLIRALLGLGAVLLLLFLGRVVFRQHAGVFNVCAVISAIPAAMMIVSFIMSLRFSPGRREVYEETEAVKGNALTLYDCAVTTRERAYAVNVFAVLNKNLIGYSEYMKDNPEERTKELTKHLEYMLKKNRFSGWGVRIFTDFPAYQERLSYLAEKNVKPLEIDRTMRQFLLEITL